LSNRSINRELPGAAGGDAAAAAASATSRRELTTMSTILDASGSLTGVDAVHTVPVQWLNTRVEETGCQVTLRKRSPPRASLNRSVRARLSSTD
jgi:Tfp pilus assembly protein PilN